jgi:hypothetical protein
LKRKRLQKFELNPGAAQRVLNFGPDSYRIQLLPLEKALRRKRTSLSFHGLAVGSPRGERTQASRRLPDPELRHIHARRLLIPKFYEVYADQPKLAPLLRVLS